MNGQGRHGPFQNEMYVLYRCPRGYCVGTRLGQLTPSHLPHLKFRIRDSRWRRKGLWGVVSSQGTAREPAALASRTFLRAQLPNY